MANRFSESVVCGLLLLTLLCVFSNPLTSGDTTIDYLFLHNGDRITLMKIGDDITFDFYSISGRSRIDIELGAGAIEEKIVLMFKNSDGWQMRSYPNDTLKITIRETGNNKGTAKLPGNSDVVIRFTNELRTSRSAT